MRDGLELTTSALCLQLITMVILSIRAPPQDSMGAVWESDLAGIILFAEILESEAHLILLL
jgi:hypothetical protein